MEVKQKKSNQRSPKDQSQSVRVIKLYVYVTSYREGISIGRFLEEGEITVQTLIKDMCCINQFLDRETNWDKQVVKGNREQRIRLVDKKKTDQIYKEQRNWSKTTPYRVLKLRFDIEEKGGVDIDEWSKCEGISRRTAERYIKVINDDYEECLDKEGRCDVICKKKGMYVKIKKIIKEY